MKWHMSIAALGACLGALVPAAGIAGGPLGDPTLDEALRQSGWEMRQVDGEGLRLYPPQGTARVTGGSAVAASAATPPTQAVEAPAAAQAGSVPDWDSVRRVGWRVERRADGSTLLYPPGTAVASEVPVPAESTAAGPVPAGAASAASTTPAAPARLSLTDMAAELRGRGWRVERDGLGALLLSPGAPDRAPQAITPSSGIETAPVREETVKVPVKRWVDARAIADAWVAEHGDGRLRVGKIRQIHRVYLVNIVGTGAPNQVVQQIAITGGNGLVVVLN
jgi:hypothetical protein